MTILDSSEVQILTLESVKELSPQQRVNNNIYQGLFEGMKTIYAQRFSEFLKLPKNVNDISWFCKAARLMGDLGAVLDIYAADRKLMDKGVMKHWDEQITQLFFEKENPHSYVNLVKGKEAEVTTCLYSAISCVTFTDLLRKSGQNISAWEIMSSTLSDVKYATDMILRFGDKDEYGREIIRIVQLKTVSKVRRVEFVETNSELVRKGMHRDPQSVKRLNEGVKYISDQEKLSGHNVIVKPFYIVVPNFDAIGNVFGIIGDKDVINDFKDEAGARGLIPKIN